MPNKLLTLLLFLLCGVLAQAADTRRAATYAQARQMAGNDGVAVFLYGPDWNPRSVRMLKNFWNSSEVEAATGNASLVAVPIYQSPSPKQKEESERISAGLRTGAPLRFCPAIILLDKQGQVYARLVGSDDLGDESGSLALRNIRDKIAVYRRRCDILRQASALKGEARARKLNEAMDLPLIPPPWLKDSIRQADPADRSGMVRRNNYDPIRFLYTQLETATGFVSKNFKPDYNKIRRECLRIANDTALRTSDRQAAYCLLIGLSRREKMTGRPMVEMINACSGIDSNTMYGRLGPALGRNWGSLHYTLSREERKKAVLAEREKKKEEKQEKKQPREKKGR